MKKYLLCLVIFIILNMFSYCFADNLGNGYKGAKWGMPPEEVKNILKDSGDYPYSVFDQSDPQYGYILIFFEEKPGDRQERINCYFYDDQLYGVKYIPYGYTGRDENNILKTMKQKYGNPKSIFNSKDGFGFPIKAYEWNNNTTKISLQAKRTSQLSTQVEVYYLSVKLKKLFNK